MRERLFLREKKEHIFPHEGTKNNTGEEEVLSPVTRRRGRRKRRGDREDAVADMERSKLGPSKIWTGLVLHHKDVFVTHVIPKLNMTDRCFFANVNRESRGVLAYAGVNVSGLGVVVNECTSISTLEWAWNHMAWGEKDNRGRVIDQASFCTGVAQTNKLELLKWAREVKQCEWDEWTIKTASDDGNLEMLKYCISNHCPCDVRTHRHVILQAISDGRVDIVKYLVEKRKISSYEDKFNCVVNAARHGQLGCLKYLLEKARAPLDRFVYIAYARYYEQPECVNYLREKGCPEPTDEQYATIVEDIEAHQDP